jgi:hypothetical protein
VTDDVIRTPDSRRPPSGSPPEDVPDGDITDDPTVAWEEGETYHPPVDPPVAGLEPDGEPRIAAGFGASGDDDPAGPDTHRTLGYAEDEVVERVREALLADSLGSLYVDGLDIQAAGTVVRLAGIVEDVDIQDHLLGVAESVIGVTEVRDALRLPDDLPGDEDTMVETTSGG